MPKIKETPLQKRESDIVKLFKMALVEKKWTTKHLAKLIGMNAANLSRVINHPMNVRLETILMIADKLDINSIPV